ncbi:MAG TPA: YhjD/YihY/BrkB family envelope integrity protein [Steroidobacteraceae bacterium]|nr:YhjD/YihY/BrkB family envelope integrity protein [Steroidobacteraceae bacterium]
MLMWLERLEDGLFQKSRGMGPPWGAILRFLRYPAALIRDWLSGEINIRAMSLAYTTLLSIVPLMVFSFAILKGLGARGDLQFILQQFFRPIGGAATSELTESVMQFVANMRGELLGSIGLAFLVYTVIATIQKVEASFNLVWRIERPRSFGRRFTEYLSVMILGPILLAVAIGLLGSAEHSPFAQWLHAVEPLAQIFGVVGRILPYALVTIVFTFMYSFIPNTHVEFRAALIGGVTAGMMWALVGKLFTAFIVYSSQLVAVYTGFAIVLTTLIWVYVSWLILLLGAQLAFYVQFPQYLRHGQQTIELSGRDREQMGLSIMYLIGRDFAAGKSLWDTRRITAELDVPGIALAPVLACLERSGLIVVTEKEEFAPGRDLEAILLGDILEAVRALQTGRLTIELRRVTAAANVMREVENALRERLGARTIKDLIAGA